MRTYLVLGLLLVVGLLSSFCAGHPAGAVTTVYIVRHAEKDLTPGVTNPALTAAGEARAAALPKAVGRRISALFSTDTRRTRSTLAPLEAATKLTLQVYSPSEAAALAARIRQEYAGKQTVVVGHSNTVLPLIAALGASTTITEIKDDEYSYLFKVRIPAKGTPTAQVLHYGAK